MVLKNNTDYNIENKVAMLKGRNINNYYENLLKQMLKAIKSNDYLKLGSLEEILNKSVIVSSKNVKNFSLIYATVKNKVLAEELTNYLELEEAEAFETFKVEPEYLTLEEAESVNSAYQFNNYSKYVNYLKERGTNFNFKTNNGFNLLLNVTYVKLEIDKVEYSTVLDYGNNINLLYDFIENSNIKQLSEETITKLNTFLDKLYNHNFNFGTYTISSNEFEEANAWNLEDLEVDIYSFLNIEMIDLESLVYAKHNDKYLVLMDSEYFILVELESLKVYSSVMYEEDTEFLAIFSDYCLGLEPEFNYNIEFLTFTSY